MDGLTGARAREQADGRARAPLTVSLIWVPPWPGLIHLDGVTMAELSEPPKITGCFSWPITITLLAKLFLDHIEVLHVAPTSTNMKKLGKLSSIHTVPLPMD